MMMAVSLVLGYHVYVWQVQVKFTTDASELEAVKRFSAHGGLTDLSAARKVPK